jgi:glycosyltransferase involved in cell wall biosynthesis
MGDAGAGIGAQGSIRRGAIAAGAKHVNSTPLISVVIPTRHRPEELRACLESLAGQSLPRTEWEVIVVEDGDENPADDALARMFAELPGHYLQQPHAGCGAARNMGVETARGRYVAFTDDDCLLPPDWLAKLASCIESADGRLIAGRPVNVLKDNPYSNATQLLLDYMLAHFNADPDRATLAIGGNFAVPAEGFRRLGGFGPEFYRKAAEERDFCARWLADERRILYVPELVVHHAHRLSFASYLRQHFHYGRGACVYHRLEGRRRGARPRLEKAGFYGGLLAWPWKSERGLDAVRLETLFVASQMAHAAGYLREMLS